MKTRFFLSLLCAAACLLSGCSLTSRLGTEEQSLLSASSLNKGDLVAFGSFEQDGDTKDGAEPLCWMVLEVLEDRALLLCRDVLAAMPFHDTYEEITWEDCSLRAFLNGPFADGTFTEQERARILTVSNQNPSNPGMESHGCGVTRDQVFLLSLEEASASMRTEEAHYVIGAADATRYAQILHLETDGERDENPGKACWWTRTSGSDQYAAAFVDRDGRLYPAGAQVTHETYCGIRPAVWVSMK